MRIAHQGGVLALDVSSNRTGVAFGDANAGAPRCLTWKLVGCNTDDELHRSLSYLRTSVSELCKLIQPRFVAVEAPLQITDRNPRTNLALISLAAVACEGGQTAGAVVERRHVQTWRKHFCGNGRPDDPKAATKRVCDLLGWKYANDDEADACGLWSYEMSIRFPKWSPKSTPLFRRAFPADGASA